MNDVYRPGWRAHETLVAPGRDRPQLWRLVLGVGLIIGVAIVVNTVVAGVLVTMAPDLWMNDLAEGRGTSPTGLLLMLSSFGSFAIGAGLAAILLHDRSPLSLIGPLPLALRQGLAVLAGLIVLGVVLAVLPPWGGGDLAPEPNLDPGLWLRLLPLALIALLIQVGTEEILFRGYLQSQLAARFSNPLIWMGVPSILFAAGHYSPTHAGDNAMLVVLWAGVFGLLMADLTARAGTLGPAIAMHFVNNVTPILFLASTDGMSGLSLYISTAAVEDPSVIRAWLPVDFAAMVVFWLTARLVLRR